MVKTTIVYFTLRMHFIHYDLDLKRPRYSWLVASSHRTTPLLWRYNLLEHILGAYTEAATSSDPLSPPTAEWLTIDSIVLTWIFTTLSKTLQQRLVAELRSIKLGALSIGAYFCKIEFIATILSSLGSPISNEDVVNITFIGLRDMYQHVSDIIIHRETFLDLKTVRSMLTTAEMRLKSKAQATYVDSTSSFPRSSVTAPPTLTQIDMVALTTLLEKLGIDGATICSQSTSNVTVPTSHEITSPLALHTAPNGFSPSYVPYQPSPIPDPPGFPLQLPAQTFTYAQLASFGHLPDHDPVTNDWKMDTGATSHLDDSISSLTDLGKHVKLPFVSFTTLVASSFDIVHLDLWTSPIPSLSGLKYYV
ncbi:hypothetical protein Tco_0904035 [Tanacetum coccineum]